LKSNLLNNKGLDASYKLLKQNQQLLHYTLFAKKNKNEKNCCVTTVAIDFLKCFTNIYENKMLSYRRETALQGAL